MSDTVAEKKPNPGARNLTPGPKPKKADRRTKVKIPKLLHDYRAVWETEEPPAGGESSGRAFLRALKKNSPEKFLGDMRKEEAEFAKRRDAAKKLDAAREKAGDIPPEPSSSEKVESAVLLELIDQLLAEGPK